MAETPAETKEETSKETSTTPAGSVHEGRPPVQGHRSLPGSLARLVRRTGAGGRGSGSTGARPAGAPEAAIHIDDRISAVFVAGAIALYVAIFAYAVLFGSGGVFTPLPTPTPRPSPTIAPSVGASPSPRSGASASPLTPPPSASGAIVVPAVDLA